MNRIRLSYLSRMNTLDPFYIIHANPIACKYNPNLRMMPIVMDNFSQMLQSYCAVSRLMV